MSSIISFKNFKTILHVFSRVKRDGDRDEEDVEILNVDNYTKKKNNRVGK